MLSFTQFLRESAPETKTKTIHQKIRELGYKKNTSESHKGSTKVWYKHPSGEHPHSPAEVAKHLGHDVVHNWRHETRAETRNKETGEHTLHQDHGELFVATFKKNKFGDISKKRHEAGYDF